MHRTISNPIPIILLLFLLIIQITVYVRKIISIFFIIFNLLPMRHSFWVLEQREDGLEILDPVLWDIPLYHWGHPLPAVRVLYTTFHTYYTLEIREGETAQDAMERLYVEQWEREEQRMAAAAAKRAAKRTRGSLGRVLGKVLVRVIKRAWVRVFRAGTGSTRATGATGSTVTTVATGPTESTGATTAVEEEEHPDPLVRAAEERLRQQLEIDELVRAWEEAETAWEEMCSEYGLHPVGGPWGEEIDGQDMEVPEGEWTVENGE